MAAATQPDGQRRAAVAEYRNARRLVAGVHPDWEGRTLVRVGRGLVTAQAVARAREVVAAGPPTLLLSALPPRGGGRKARWRRPAP